jgi:hypothetical protein
MWRERMLTINLRSSSILLIFFVLLIFSESVRSVQSIIAEPGRIQPSSELTNCIL